MDIALLKRAVMEDYRPTDKQHASCCR